MDWSLEGTSPDNRSTVIYDKACWFVERFSEIGDSTGIIIVIIVSDWEAFGFGYLYLWKGIL